MMGLRMKNYKIFEVHLKVQLLEGGRGGRGSQKTNIERGILPRKGGLLDSLQI